MTTFEILRREKKTNVSHNPFSKLSFKKTINLTLELSAILKNDLMIINSTLFPLI